MRLGAIRATRSGASFCRGRAVSSSVSLSVPNQSQTQGQIMNDHHAVPMRRTASPVRQSLIIKRGILAWLCAGILPVLIALLGGASPSAQGANIQLVDATNTVWRYHTNKFDPGYTPVDSWIFPAFDDSSWPTGKGTFGLETTA